MKVGLQKRIPAPTAGSKQRHHLIGAYTWRTDTVTWKTVLRKNRKFYITFLEFLLVTVYPL